MFLRRELPTDQSAVRAVHNAAFGGGVDVVEAHLDVQADDLAVAIAAAETLGACRVGDVAHDSMGRFQVLRDPEGNEWCLVHNEVRVPPPSAR